MTETELKKLIAQGEGETVEFKETTGQRGEACKTLCAFMLDFERGWETVLLDIGSSMTVRRGGIVDRGEMFENEVAFSLIFS